MSWLFQFSYCLHAANKNRLFYSKIKNSHLLNRFYGRYFLILKKEGALRGYQIDLEALEISGSIVELNQGHVAGICTYSSQAPNIVEIDATFWNSNSSFIREMVVFHELGHCVLNRGHDETTFTNGVCESIMRSGVGDCLDNYNANTRTNYLNELFAGHNLGAV